MSNYTVQAVLELKDKFTNVVNKAKNSVEKTNTVIKKMQTNISNFDTKTIEKATKKISKLEKGITKATKKTRAFMRLYFGREWFRKITGPIVNMGKFGVDKFTTGIKSAISSIKSTISGMFKFITAGIVGALGYGIKKAADFEEVKTSLIGALRGDTKTADKYYNQAVELSKKTAFSPEEVGASFATLINAKIDPNRKDYSGREVGTKIMDLASKTFEKDVVKFTKAMVKAQGGNADELFESLIGVGLTRKDLEVLGKQIAKKTGDGNYANMFKNGGFQSQMGKYLVNTVLYAAGTDSRILGEADRFSQTAKGALSTLKGNIDILLKSIVDPTASGTGIFGYFKKGMIWLNNNLDFEKYGKKISEWIQKSIIDRLPNISELKTVFDEGSKDGNILEGIENVLKEIWGSDLFTNVRAIWNKIEPIIGIVQQITDVLLDIFMLIVEKLAPKRIEDPKKLQKLKETDFKSYLKHERAYNYENYRDTMRKLGLSRLSEVKDTSIGFFESFMDVGDLALKERENANISKNYIKQLEESESKKIENLSERTNNNVKNVNFNPSKYEENNVNNIKNEDKSSENNIINQAKYEENKINQINKEETNNKNIITNKNEKNINNTQIKEEHFKNENSNPQIIANKNPETNNMSFNINLDFSNTQFGVGVTKEYVNESLNRYLKNWQLELTTFVEGTI